MNPQDAEEYTQSLGQVLGGGWRQIALGVKLGAPEALGLSTQEWVRDRLGGYTKVPLPERREAVAELAEEGMSQREIGAVLGVGKTTVLRDLAPPGPNGPSEDQDQVVPPAPGPNGPPNPGRSEDLWGKMEAQVMSDPEAAADVASKRFRAVWSRTIEAVNEGTAFDPEAIRASITPTELELAMATVRRLEKVLDEAANRDLHMIEGGAR